MKKHYTTHIAQAVFACLLLLFYFPTTAQTLSWVGSLADATQRVTVNAVTQDANSDVYIVGQFRETADFDMGAGVFNLTSTGNFDVFVAKYDLNGTFIWAFQIGSIGISVLEITNAFDIAVDAANNIVIGGEFRGINVNFAPLGGTLSTLTSSSSGNQQDAFLAKYNPAGQCIWAFNMGSGSINGEIYGVTTDAVNNIYISGLLNDNGTAGINVNPMGASVLVNTDGSDAMLIKYNATGQHLWNVKVSAASGATLDIGRNVQVLGANVYLCGGFTGTCEFNPLGTSITRTAVAAQDAFIAQYNSTTGICNWANALGTGSNEDVHRMVLDATGNVYATGFFNGTLDLNPGAGTNNIVAVGSTDIFVAKYDISGNYVWGFGMGGLDSDNGYGIDIDGSNLYVTGRFRGTADFDPSAATVNLTASGGAVDEAFLAKYTTAGAYVNAFSIQGTGADQGLDVYANAGVVYLVGYFSAPSADFDPIGTATVLCAGTGTNWDGFVACYSDLPPVTLEDIAITEWLANPSGTETLEEWIELYNFGASTVNLKNWKIQDEGTDNATISTTDLFLASGQYLILAKNKAQFEQYWLNGCANSNVVQVSIVLANTADEIILVNSTGDVQWSVAYQNDDTEGRATYYTEATYATRVFGSKASPGIVRAGNDVTGSLGYQKNNATADALAYANAIGDFGSPLNPNLVGYTRGNELAFDGVDDYLNLGATTGLEGQSAFTFEAWVKPITISAAVERIFSKRLNNTNRIEISMGNGGATDADRQFITVHICNGANETATIPNGTVPLGVWTHIAVVFDGTQSGANRLKVYINGIAQTVSLSPTAIATPSGNGVAHIGKNSTAATNYSNINIEEIRLWNLARTLVQVRENMHLTLNKCQTGLVSYYQLNETAGTIASDAQGTNNATYGDGVTATTFPTLTASIVNVGNSTASLSQTITAIPTGVSTQTFTTAKAEMRFFAHSGVEDITVTYQAFTPNGITGVDGFSIIQNPMWTVNKSSATETMLVDYTFTFPAATFTNLVPTKYSLYWRSMNSGSNWTKIATAHSITTTTASFGKISLTGQFMVVQESDVLVSDVRGSMYTFDGVNDHILTSPSPTYTNNSFTFEAWIKTNTTNQSEIAAWGHTGGLDDVQIRNSGATGKLDFGIYSGSYEQITSATSINTGQWTHIAIVKNNNNVSIYINGVLDATGATALNPSVNTMAIGALYYNGSMCCNYFNGFIDEVRVWNVVRTQAQIRENIHLTLKGNETGLVSYYQFNNDNAVGSVGGVKDAKGTNHGTATNMVAANYLASEVAVAGGTSDRITIGASGVYDFPNTGVSIQFGAATPNGELVISRLETEKPHGAENITGDVDNEYFVVNNYGSNSTFTALTDITFSRLSYVSPVDIGVPQASSPLNLYKRNSNAYGVWGATWGGSDNGMAGTNGAIGFNATNNLTSFSQIVIVNTSTNSDLPVELLYFDAKRNNPDQVELNWATASELNNQGFYVERMLDNETQFSELAWIDGNGTTLNTSYYTTTDANSYIGISYYRLRQVDFDGTISYSEIRSVEGLSDGQYISLNIYPNPVEEELNIRFLQLPKAVNSAKIKILSVDGKLLHEFTTAITSNQQLSIDFVKKLHPGLYMLAIETNDEEMIIHKFVKR